MYKVCVIEDETIIRKGLIKAINWEKYNCRVVAEAGNGKEGLRVIAVAIKQLDEIPANPNCDELENDLTFVGIIGIEDNISPKAASLLTTNYLKMPYLGL